MDIAIVIIGLAFFSSIALLFAYLGGSHNKRNKPMIADPINSTNTYSDGLTNSEPTKKEIIGNLIEANSGSLTRLMMRHHWQETEPSNPFKLTKSAIMTRTLLLGHENVSGIHVETLESALKELLGKEYDTYYEAAKRRVLNQHSH